MTLLKRERGRPAQRTSQPLVNVILAERPPALLQVGRVHHVGAVLAQHEREEIELLSVQRHHGGSVVSLLDETCDHLRVKRCTHDPVAAHPTGVDEVIDEGIVIQARVVIAGRIVIAGGRRGRRGHVGDLVRPLRHIAHDLDSVVVGSATDLDLVLVFVRCVLLRGRVVFLPHHEHSTIGPTVGARGEHCHGQPFELAVVPLVSTGSEMQVALLDLQRHPPLFALVGGVEQSSDALGPDVGGVDEDVSRYFTLGRDHLDRASAHALDGLDWGILHERKVRLALAPVKQVADDGRREAKPVDVAERGSEQPGGVDVREALGHLIGLEPVHLGQSA